MNRLKKEQMETEVISKNWKKRRQWNDASVVFATEKCRWTGEWSSLHDDLCPSYTLNLS